MNCVLGIDGGGSKTVCLLMGDTGKVLGRGEAGGANYQSIGITAAQTAIQSAIHQAVVEGLKQIEDINVTAICLGLAGVSRPQDIEVVQGIVVLLQNHNYMLPITWALSPSRIVICHDALIALMGGVGDAVGIVVAAGTGSMVFGRNHQGYSHRVGGWGYILGDEGSAYKIAVCGLQAALKAYDGRGMLTSLVENFQEHLGIENIENLIEVVYRRGWGVKEIAALAPIVDRAAIAGDIVANHIIEQAVAELAIATSTVSDRVFNPSEVVEIVTTGGVWQAQCNLRDKFVKYITHKYPLAKVIYPRHEPAYGAGLLALKQLTVDS
jgi:N-acetylglucosamine kinase